MGDDKFQFSIDRGGTFTDIYAKCPGGKIRVMKLLSINPNNYNDAPTEGIRRILAEVLYKFKFVKRILQYLYNLEFINIKCYNFFFYNNG